MNGDDSLAAIRAALQVSPDNLPLLRHLGEMLLGLGRADDAEREFRGALARFPGDGALKLGLARSFHQQGKASHAQVVVEELTAADGVDPGIAARAGVLHARLLHRAGEVERAVRAYKRAIALDDGAGDHELAERLGVRPLAESADAEVVDGRLRASADGDETTPDVEIEKPGVTFADVGGMEKLKEEIRLKIIYPLAHRDLYAAYGKTVGGGILMYGPPGCGKTHLARCTAGEIKARFMAVGINDVIEMWIGNSERNLHGVFEMARRNKPCVLFFDEVDALAASRADMRQSAGRFLINQFLSELDGVDAKANDGVLILAATNAPWHLDAAFRRPGRFDRILFVPPPDAPARADILRLLLKGKPTRDVDADQVAKKLDNLSGADLKAVVDVAIERKLSEAVKSGVPMPLTTKDLVAAAAGVRPSTREWFSTAKNHALYANQDGAYDDVLTYLKLTK